MGATEDFVQIATRDLMGKQGPSQAEMSEAARRDSPAISSFADIATKDLMGVPDSKSRDINLTQVLENAEDLRNAFAGSMLAPQKTDHEEIKEKVVEEFKEVAGEEAQAVLSKLLKGLR